LLKTFDEICDDETICDYCSQTDWGEHKSYGTPNGQVFCEGTWCKDSYEAYLDDNNATENLVKYQNSVRLLNKEELNGKLIKV
jgi:hypothetical protein